ncbi:hypothetical protein ABMA58_00110 [Oceanospirillum sp. HFRX-1_2]
MINSALVAMGGKFNSPAAARLLLGTAAKESNCGSALQQYGGGPACGPFQMEPWVALDHASYMRKFAPVWAAAVQRASGVDPTRLSELEMVRQLTGNLLFAAAMCRIDYWREKEPLPRVSDTTGLGGYWKRYYNTGLGKGTIGQFVNDLNRVEVDAYG